jgi:hypothetical protein
MICRQCQLEFQPNFLNSGARQGFIMKIGRSSPVQFVSCLILAMLLNVCAGCGNSNQTPHYPVSGIVTLDEKPLVNAAVMFFPRGATKGNACLGYTDETGKYTLAPERDGGSGCPEGEFAVMVSKLKDPPPGTPAGAAETDADQMLSPLYWDTARTILKAQVPKGGTTVDFPLKSKP